MSHSTSKRTNGATWTVAEAKARLSEVIERACSTGPQTVTRNGRTAVVVVAAEEWERKTKRTCNLAEFFASSPLRGAKLEVERPKGGLRPTGTDVDAWFCELDRFKDVPLMQHGRDQPSMPDEPERFE